MRAIQARSANMSEDFIKRMFWYNSDFEEFDR